MLVDLSGKFMRSSKWAFAFLSCVLSIGIGAQAQDPLSTMNKWLGRSEAIQEKAASMAPPDWLRTEPNEEAMRAAEKLKDRAEVIRKRIASGDSPSEAADHWSKTRNAKLDVPGELPAEQPQEKTESFIFVSQSMPVAEMKAAIEVSTETGATLIYRGIKKGQAIDHISKHVADIIRGKPDLTPSVIINPNLFKMYGVEAVPTSVVIMNGRMIRATGTLSIDYLLQKLEDGKSGDLGLIGRTYEVVEPDLIDELKRRTELIDWQKETEGAAGRYWTHSWPKFGIPPSTEHDEFLVDPTFTLAKDIVARGKVLAKAGQTYNAQKLLPMTQVIVFFDGTDKDQLRAVKKRIATFGKPMEAFMLVATDIDRERGFDAMGELQDFFGYPVKLLEKGMVERFKVKAVPSFVSGSGDFYKVEQLAIQKQKVKG